MIVASRLHRALLRAAVNGLCVSILAIPIDAGAQPAAADAAANRNQQALELAQRLGRERSAEGLETIIGAHNVDLITAYERGLRETSIRIYTDNKYKASPLPADIEALIVKHYQDPLMGGALRSLCASNGTKYQTRGLFDLMYAEWRSGKVRPSNYPMRDSILQTDLAGIEAPLLALLQTFDRPEMSDGTVLIGFLAGRKYRPAVPVFMAMVKDAKPGAEFASTVHNALLTIGTADAIDAVLRRLGWLRAQPAGPDVARETTALISRISQVPAETPLDYAAFRKALPAALSDDAKSNLLGMIERRKEKQGVPDVLALLAETKFFQGAVGTLIAFDSPEIWRQTRAEVERLKQQGALNEGQYLYARSLLDAKIADPEKHFAMKKQFERQKEFDAKRAPLNATRNALQKLRDAQPEQYVAGLLDFLKSEERLAQEYADLPATTGLRSEMGNDYLNLGHLVRFKLRQTARALELYASADRLGNQVMAAFAIADTYQFDLRDKAKALAAYQRMLEQLQRTPGSRNETEAAFVNWVSSWLAHQAEYLKTGKTFSGALGRDDVAGAGMLLYFGAGSATQDDYLGLAPLYRPLMGDRAMGDRAMGDTAMGRAGPPQFDRNAIAKSLDALPSSGLTLLRSVPLVTLMPDANAILRYLERHDPAGYASACLFALVDVADRQAGAPRETAMLLPGLALPPAGAANPLRAAGARFFKERRISLKIEGDPRLPRP